MEKAKALFFLQKNPWFVSDFLVACDYRVSVFLIPVGVYAENPAICIISSYEAMIFLGAFGDYMMKPVCTHIPRTAGDFGVTAVCFILFL